MGINAIIEQDIVSTFQKFNPETIILFGSYAHGNPDEESDIDIIVIYHTPKRFLDRLEELYLSWDIPKAVDILAYTPDEFDQMKKENAFIHDALKHGRVIYERA
jgi:predicted nucleotidyltransferase